MYTFLLRAPASRRILAVAASFATLIAILVVKAEPTAWAEHTEATATAGVTQPAPPAAAQEPSGPALTLAEARAAFRWEANNISNRSFSAYMGAPENGQQATYQQIRSLVTNLLQALGATSPGTSLPATAPTLPEASVLFQAAAEEAFGLAAARYETSADWATYRAISDAFGDAINGLKNQLQNDPDDVWTVAVRSCLGTDYATYDPMPNRPPNPDGTSAYPEFHALRLRARIPFTNGAAARCPGPGVWGRRGPAERLPAGPSPALQGNDDIECPRGWCPHRGGCIPCGG